MKRALALIAAIAVAITVAVTAGAGPASANSETELRPVRNHNLLIIGASYTAGWGATSPRDDYAHRLADDLGWPTQISAEPGAGYLSRGNNGHDSFRQQIASLPSNLRPGLVIVQGGRDDIGQPAAKERAAIVKTIAAIRAKFDDPQIALLGDVPATVPVAPDAVATNDLIAGIAASQHAVFIDPIREHWMTPADAHAFRSHIPGHPNDAGHAYIAQRLLLDLSHRADGTIGAASSPNHAV
jgi:lysophospholipase L1-like esterase